MQTVIKRLVFLTTQATCFLAIVAQSSNNQAYSYSQAQLSSKINVADDSVVFPDDAIARTIQNATQIKRISVSRQLANS